jgi:tetratricopeptide (TPR) repeat protein
MNLRLARSLGITALLVAAVPASAQVRAQRGAENPNQPCGMIYTDHYGPYDFRTQRGSLKIVEDFHFTARVESLAGAQSGYIGGDLNYTLRASPNHHRALVSLMRWVERNKADQTRGMDFPAECYFDRAIRFRPDDTVVRALYAQFLHKRNRTEEGLKQLDLAVGMAEDNALTHYNLGLVYLELGATDQALAQAHRAMALGFPRQDLANELKKLGRWRDPVPAAPAASAASASAG